MFLDPPVTIVTLLMPAKLLLTFSPVLSSGFKCVERVFLLLSLELLPFFLLLA